LKSLNSDPVLISADNRDLRKYREASGSNRSLEEHAMAQAATITEAQLRRVLQYVSTRRHALRDRTILLVSFNAGLRAKEIASLLVGDIYDDAGAVREQFILRRAQTKGGYERTVYLNKTLRRAMAEYRELVEHRKSTDTLFSTQKRSAFSPTTMCQLFLEIYTASGVNGASSHSGRRTFITRLANKGVGVRQLAALAGHADISTTQRYIDVNAEQLANAVELL
jgi:integrase/recombinase XerD